MASTPDILSKPGALWRDAPPWSKRPKDTGGGIAQAFGLKSQADKIRSMAKGWHPANGSKSENLEHKATLLGGLQTLALAGISPWSSLDLTNIPQMKYNGDTAGNELTILTNQVRSQRGLAPAKDLKTATEYVRREVDREKLANAAWFYRAAILAGVAGDKQAKAGKVTKAVGGVFGAIGTGIGIALTASIIGAPLGVPLTIASTAATATVTAKGAATGLEQQRSATERDGYIARFNQELSLAQGRSQVKETEMRVKNTVSALVTTPPAEAAAEDAQAEKIAQIVVWSGLGLLALGIGYGGYTFITRSSRDTKSTK